MTSPSPKIFETLSRVLGTTAARADELFKNSPLADLDKNARQYIVAQLSKEGLVTREDYDIQTALLAKTRAKLQELEVKIAALEASLETSAHTSAQTPPKKKL